MRNLKLLSGHTCSLHFQSEDEHLIFSTIDIERNRAFFVSSSNLLYSLNLPSSQEERLRSKMMIPVEGEPIDLEPGDCITALDFLIEKEAIIIGTLNGYLLLHNVDDNISEIVGRVEDGVKSISPSPDGAVLAVTAGLGQILVMTPNWEVLYEATLGAPELNTSLVSGDTSGLSDPSLESHVAWRGDGKYFATLIGVNNSSLQKLRIWEQDSGTLHATSESKAFIGSSLDWMPSGAKVVAAYDRKAENKSPLIVFFERNGLERSSLNIDEPMEAMVDILKWNCTSDILAASVRCEEYDVIKLWSFSNNHWYLKQEIRYPKEDRVKFTWDPTKSLQLICWILGGKVDIYSFVWNTAVMDNSTAFVIDGTNVLVSSLALSLMPPPMSLFNLKFPFAVQHVAFFSKNLKNRLAVSLSDGSLCIVELPIMDKWEELEGEEYIIEASHSDIKCNNFRHLIWLDSHVLLGVSRFESIENKNSHQQGKNINCNYVLLEIELICSENAIPGLVTSSGWHANVSKHSLLEMPIVGLVPNPTKKCSAFVQFDGGFVAEYSSKVGILEVPTELYLRKPDHKIGFSSSCPWMNAVPVSDNGTLKPLVMGLDDSGRLHFGGKVLCNDCSSFSFYSNTTGSTEQVISHLILTTKQDFLFIISIVDILHANPEIKFDNNIHGGVKNKGENRDCINIWERGSMLVAVINGDEAAVILQTTRGNLECIYPRKLVLLSIVNALVQRRFKEAMLMVRRHRINFNVIVDHCGWQTFLQSIAEFVTQVNNLTHITEFICSIKNENVMESLYKNVIPPHLVADTKTVHSIDFKRLDMKSKVTSVMLAMKKALEEQLPESPARELCILTALARSEPPALEEALKRTKEIREMELSGTDESCKKLCPSAEEAIKHLLWLSDNEAVYEAALGLYDLNLAAIVAINSQKDPKEFLPFFQGLERMPPLVMRYTIDLKLHRYESALKHIFSAGEAYYEDCIDLIKSHPQLFPLGVQLFSGGTKRSQLLEAWGDHLCCEKCYEDAATTYLCCCSLQKALKAYRACGSWRGVLSVAGLLKLGEEEVLQLANELCEELQALGMPAEAARIALEYCGDVAAAIGYFVIAREWEEALRICYLHRREDLISDTKNSAFGCASMLISEYEEGLEKVGKYLARYLAVRQRRLVLAAKLQSEERSIDDVDDDSASETSSAFSGMSAYSGSRTGKGSSASVNSSTTSKPRGQRRQKHKGGKIRAGSPGEEMALVEHLRGMALTSGAQRELKSLINALVMLGKDETGRKLQRVAETFQMSQQAAVKLAEETLTNNIIDEKIHSLEHYIEKVRGDLLHSEAFSWRCKVLLFDSR